MSRILMLAGLLGLCALSGLRAEEPFVVHEWGVWVRQVQGPSISAEGVPVQGQGYADIGAPKELLSGLPAFVKHYQPVPVSRVMNQNWDKPVLHLYGPEGLQCKLTLKFPQGQPTAFWPLPISTTEANSRGRFQVTRVTSMFWEGRLSAAAPADLPKSPEKHWWNAVRAVPGMYINTAQGSERFLFYEGTAAQQPTLNAVLDSEVLTLKNGADQESGPVLVVAYDGQTLWWKSVTSLAASAKLDLKRTELEQAPGDADKLLDAARAQWLAFGLTKEESAAIVESWKPDLTKHVGLMVIARLPAPLYEKMFPLEVTPKPKEIVRAGVIFDTLPGSTERMAWLPGLKAKLDGIAKDLSADEFGRRTSAKSALAAHGELISGYLMELTKSDDLEVRNAAKSLLEGLKPKQDLAPEMQEPQIRGKR